MLQHEDSLAQFIKQQGEQPKEVSAVWACLGRLAHSAGTYQMTHDSLATNASLFFVAGYETTSNLITFATLELAANQGLQVRCSSPCHNWNTGQTFSGILVQMQPVLNRSGSVSCSVLTCV